MIVIIFLLCKNYLSKVMLLKFGSFILCSVNMNSLEISLVG